MSSSVLLAASGSFWQLLAASLTKAPAAVGEVYTTQDYTRVHKDKWNLAKRAKVPKSIIGWREWCALPELSLPGVLAKIDTGAKTSALHAFNIKKSTRGEEWLSFSVHPVQRRKQPIIHCEALCIDMRSITSSNGKSEERPVIQTELVIGERRFVSEITLTNRDDMGFRMLIGRQSLHHRFIVDPALSYCCGDKEERQLYPPAITKG